MTQSPALRTTVLVVEDEYLIAVDLQETLSAAGFSVVLHFGGADAIKDLDQSAMGIAALVTDIRLGEGPTGWEVARHARRLNPELPVVYTSGDSAHGWEAEGVPSSVFLQKPYASAQVVTAVSTLINRTC